MTATRPHRIEFSGDLAGYWAELDLEQIDAGAVEDIQEGGYGLLLAVAGRLILDCSLPSGKGPAALRTLPGGQLKSFLDAVISAVVNEVKEQMKEYARARN